MNLKKIIINDLNKEKENKDEKINDLEKNNNKLLEENK